MDTTRVQQVPGSEKPLRSEPAPAQPRRVERTEGSGVQRLEQRVRRLEPEPTDRAEPARPEPAQVEPISVEPLRVEARPSPPPSPPAPETPASQPGERPTDPLLEVLAILREVNARVLSIEERFESLTRRRSLSSRVRGALRRLFEPA